MAVRKMLHAPEADQAQWPTESLTASAAPTPEPYPPAEELEEPHPQPQEPQPTAVEESIPTTASYRALLDRVPVDFLLEADGDITHAAALAGVPVGDFYRALATDRALPLVARTIHFMTIMGTFRMFSLARDEIVTRLVEPPDSIDDDMSDPRPGANMDLKALIALVKVSSDFIAAANSNSNPPPKTNRYQPPTKGEILNASRSLNPALANPANPNFSTGQAAQNAQISAADQAMEEAAQTLEERLAKAPPRIKALFARAIVNATEADDDDDMEEEDDC